MAKRLTGASEVPLQDQILFLEECFRVSTAGFAKAQNDVQRNRAKRAQLCLNSTLELLESMTSGCIIHVVDVGREYRIVMSIEDQYFQMEMSTANYKSAWWQAEQLQKAMAKLRVDATVKDAKNPLGKGLQGKDE